MKKKSIISGIVLGFLYFTVTSQGIIDSSSYYYYKSEKQYLTINTQSALVAMPAAELSKRTAKSGLSNRVNESKHKNHSEIVFGDSLSPKDYLEQLAALEKSLNVRIRGYFQSELK